MLQVPSEFPHPGSIAVHDGVRCRVLQTLADGRRLVVAAEGGAQPRRVPLDDLADPRDADMRALAERFDPVTDDARRALWIARRLRAVNDIALAVLDRDMASAARDGLVPVCRDTRHLTAILRRMGWRRDGFTGAGYDRTPLYRRVGGGATGQGAAA